MTLKDDGLAEIKKLEEKIAHEREVVGTWVKVHYVWIAGALGLLIGFIAGKVV